MKKQAYDSLLDGILFSVASTYEEFDQLAGEVGACLTGANNDAVYRGSLADWRYHFLHGLDQKTIDSDAKLEPKNRTFVDGVKPFKGVDDQTGISRMEIPVMDEKTGKQRVKDGVGVTTFDPKDSESKYFKRVCATLVEQKKFPSVDAAKASFKKFGQEVADMIRFNVAPRPETEKGPGKLAQKYKDLARLFITGKKNLQGLQLALKKDLDKQFVPITTNGEGKPVAADADENVEALGRLCKEWEAAQDVFSKIK